MLPDLVIGQERHSLDLHLPRFTDTVFLGGLFDSQIQPVTLVSMTSEFTKMQMCCLHAVLPESCHSIFLFSGKQGPDLVIQSHLFAILLGKKEKTETKVRWK